MSKCFVVKRQGPVLTPASEADKEALDRLPLGQNVSIEFKRVRNLHFHRKFFALCRYAYDLWEPAKLEDSPWDGVVPERNFDRFRKDLIIRAGYYECAYRLDGSIRVEAKSIAFENMEEDEFEKMYSRTIDVIIKHICTTMTGAELDHEVETALGFAG